MRVDINSGALLKLLPVRAEDQQRFNSCPSFQARQYGYRRKSPLAPPGEFARCQKLGVCIDSGKIVAQIVGDRTRHAPNGCKPARIQAALDWPAGFQNAFQQRPHSTAAPPAYHNGECGSCCCPSRRRAHSWDNSSKGRVSRRDRTIISTVPESSAKRPALKTIRSMRSIQRSAGLEGF